jgi:hypothetical protein
LQVPLTEPLGLLKLQLSPVFDDLQALSASAGGPLRPEAPLPPGFACAIAEPAPTRAVSTTSEEKKREKDLSCFVDRMVGVFLEQLKRFAAKGAVWNAS